MDDALNTNSINSPIDDYLGNTQNPVLNVPAANLQHLDSRSPEQVMKVRRLVRQIFMGRVEAAIWFIFFASVIVSNIVRGAEVEEQFPTLSQILDHYSNTASLIYTILTIYLFSFAYYQFMIISFYCERLTLVYMYRGRFVPSLQFYNCMIYLLHIISIVAWAGFVGYDLSEAPDIHISCQMVANCAIYISFIFEIIFYMSVSENRLNPTLGFVRVFLGFVFFTSGMVQTIETFNAGYGRSVVFTIAISQHINFCAGFLLLLGNAFDYNQVWKAIPPNKIAESYRVFSIIGIFNKMYLAPSPLNSHGGVRMGTNPAGQNIIRSPDGKVFVSPGPKTKPRSLSPRARNNRIGDNLV